MSNDNNDNDQLILETLGSIETIHKIDELYNPEYECNLVDALKSKNNIIEKAKMYSFNRVVYKQKAKFARSLDSLANTDYQDTFQNQTNEFNFNNINNNLNNCSVNENEEELKLFENCSLKKNNNNNNPDNVSNIYFNNLNNNYNSNTNNKTSFINNSILNNKLIEEKNFDNLQIGKKLRILRNFVDIDEKIKFGYINVVPKGSLLHVNENKFLSYNEIKKEIKKKELERNQKLKESSIRNIKNLTPFQSLEITKNILKEKIKFKKDIYFNQKNLLNNIVDGTEITPDNIDKSKRNSVNTQTNFEMTKEFTIAMETTRREYLSNSKILRNISKLPNINMKLNFNTKNKFNNGDKNHLTIFDKFYNTTNKTDENKTYSNYNKSEMRTGFNTNYNESERMFHILPKYRDNLNELNILEENINQDVSSLNNSISKNSNIDIPLKNISNNLSSNKKDNKNNKGKLINKENNNLKNISIVEDVNLNVKGINKKENNKNAKFSKENKKEKTENISTPNNRNLNSSSFKNNNSNSRNNLLKMKTRISERSKNLNSDLNASGSHLNVNINKVDNIYKNNTNEVNNEQVSHILPLIENNQNLKNFQENEDEKNTFENTEEKTFENNNSDEIKDLDLNNAISDSRNLENNQSSNDNEIKSNQNEENQTRENENNIELNINNKNIDNSLNGSNILNSNNISKIRSNKKSSYKYKNIINSNNKSFESNKSISLEHDNSCIKYKKSAERIFPNEPTFYGSLDPKNLNNKSNKNNLNLNNNNFNCKNLIEDEKKINYVNAAKTTLNYLSNALKTNIFSETKKKNIFDLNSSNAKINFSSYKLSSNRKDFISKDKLPNINFKENSSIYNNSNINNNGKHHTKIRLEKIKTHIKKVSQNDILVNQLNDDSINDNVEIFKNILNSRDYIPQSNFDIIGTPRGLKPSNYNNYKNKSKKALLADSYNNNYGNKKFDAERFIVRNGFSYSPLDITGPFRFKDKKV